MKSLVEAVKELELLKEQLAVWSEVMDHLSTFVDSDVALAKAGIAIEKNSKRIVPQHVVVEIARSITTEKIAPISGKILELEQLPVSENSHGLNGKKSSKKEKASGKKVQPHEKVQPRIGGPQLVRPPSKA